LKWRLTLREEVKSCVFNASISYLSPQLGLDVKAKPTEELTETVEMAEIVDEDQQIQEEACLTLNLLISLTTDL